MQRFSSNKYLDRTTADSYATLFGSRIPMLFSDKRAEVLSKSVAAELEMTAEQDYHVKLSEPPYQEQDSSSTLSNGQSHEHTISFQTGPIETCKKRGENSVEASVACGKADFPGYQLQTEHNQSLDWISYQLTAPCFGRMTTVYDPNAVVYPQMMGVAPGRVVLQPDCTQGIPVYVNAKQYHAILRRRQTRARLEAQNKVAKSRKPYLHESRHRHALKRARGSGGRFLNVKNVHQSKPKLAAKMAGKNLIQLMNKEPKTHLSKSDSWGTSTTSGSDFSSIFNNDDIFQQPNLRVANSSIRSRLMGPDDSLMLTMDRRAQISTAT